MALEVEAEHRELLLDLCLAVTAVTIRPPGEEVERRELLERDERISLRHDERETCSSPFHPRSEKRHRDERLGDRPVDVGLAAWRGRSHGRSAIRVETGVLGGDGHRRQRTAVERGRSSGGSAQWSAVTGRSPARRDRAFAREPAAVVVTNGGVERDGHAFAEREPVEDADRWWMFLVTESAGSSSRCSSSSGTTRPSTRSRSPRHRQGLCRDQRVLPDRRLEHGLEDRAR